MAFRVLIIGGTGQVGAAVVRALVRQLPCLPVELQRETIRQQVLQQRLQVIRVDTLGVRIR